MGKRRQTSRSENDRTRSPVRRVFEDSESESESIPLHHASNRSRPANESPLLYDDDDQTEEDCSYSKRRRTHATPLEPEDVATGSDVEVPDNALRRSSRDTAIKSGPQAYSKRWHPIDDLKKRNRNISQERSKSPGVSSSKRSSSLIPETSDSRAKAPHPNDKETYEASIVPTKLSNSPRRRSSRNVYDAETAMKYDMSSHWSYRKVMEPQAFAKKLEVKRKSLASTVRREASDVQDLLQSPSEPQKDLRYQKDETYHSSIDADTLIDSNEGKSPRSTHSKETLQTDQHNNNVSLSNEGMLTATSPAAGSPMALDDDLVWPDSDSDIPLITPAIKKKVPDHHLVRSLPIRRSPTVTPPAGGSPMALDDDLVWPEADSDVPLAPLVGKKKTQDSLIRSLPIRKSPEVKVQPLDWNDMTEFDRRLYSLQKGAPRKGNTLPLKWSIIGQILIEEGFDEVSGSQINSKDTSYLKNRYEYVRLGLEAFFNAEPEPDDKKDWTLFHIEGFDVYDKTQGSKYWKRHGDNVVKPIETVVELDVPIQEAPVSAEDYKEKGKSSEDLRVSKAGVTDEAGAQGIITTPTQIDNHLALAEPSEETEALLSLRDSMQDISSSTITLIGDAPEQLPDAAENDQAAHERSEQTLMDIMGAPQPASSYAGVDMFDIEALLEDTRRSQGENPKPGLKPLINGVATPSPIKRRKRKTAQDFFIFEDETASHDEAAATETTNEVSLRESGGNLDLPVENMSTGELVPGSQEDRIIGYISRRIRHPVGNGVHRELF